MAKGKRRKSIAKSRAAAAKPRVGGRFAKPTPPFDPTVEATKQQVMEQQVDFLNAIIAQREAMGIPTEDLEKVVVGIEGKLGVRKQLQEFVTANLSKFRAEDPSGAAARVLFTEVVSLSEESLEAGREEAAKIYQKLKFIRELAAKTQGAQSPLAKELERSIAPIEEQLKKRTTFQAFVREKAETFKKTLPERLAAKIPIVGGFLGEFLQQKREGKEELERFSGGLQKDISRAGKRGFAGLDFDGFGKRSVGSPSSVSGMFGRVGTTGTAASAIPGLLAEKPDTLLGGIYAEVRKIREILVDRFEPSTDELKSRESELEAGRSAGLGAKTGARSRGGGIRGLVSDLLDGKLKRTRLGKGLRRARIFGKRMMRRFRGFGRGGRGLLSRLGKGISRSRLFRRGRVAGKMLSRSARGLVGRAAGGARGLVSSAARGAGGLLGRAGGLLSRAAGAVSGAVSSLNPVKAMGEAVKSGAPKILKSIVSVPGLGAILSGIMGAIDISSIKSDPNLTPDQKKEQIGTRLVTVLGQALGSIGGGALGSLIPVPGVGTLIGSLGGMWVGEKLAELLAEAIGPKKIYDMVSSIPGISSLIKVDSAEGKEAEPRGAGAEGAMGGEGTQAQATATGTVSAPATPNTSLGAMIGAHNSEMGSLDAAKTAASSTTKPAPTTNNAVVNSKVNNTVNNFNDDLRIRNNEPTIKQAQMLSMVSW